MLRVVSGELYVVGCLLSVVNSMLLVVFLCFVGPLVFHPLRQPPSRLQITNLLNPTIKHQSFDFY